MTQQALALEPRLLLTPSRCRILRKGVGEDTHQLLIALEGEIDKSKAYIARAQGQAEGADKAQSQLSRLEALD